MSNYFVWKHNDTCASFPILMTDNKAKTHDVYGIKIAGEYRHSLNASHYIKRAYNTRNWCISYLCTKT